MSARLREIAGRANPSCRSAMGTVSESLDRPLSRLERLAIAAHMLHCPACRRARSQLSMIVSALRTAAGLPGLPLEVRDRIKKAFRDE